MSTSVEVSAPGKLFLFGEHAVLYNRQAIIAAIKQYITVYITRRNDELVNIGSGFGSYSAPLSRIKPSGDLSFIQESILHCKDIITSGLDIRVESGFTIPTGVGSSSALVVALVTGIFRIEGKSLEKPEIFQRSLDIVTAVQRMASGGDVAAAVYGGIILYRKSPPVIESLEVTPPLFAVHSGKKEKTARVIGKVREKQDQFPDLFDHIYSAMDRIAGHGADALRQKDWRLAGELMNVNQGLLDAIGVSDRTLSGIIHELRTCDGVYGSKISGAGLGDFVIGLGNIAGKSLKYPVFPVQVSHRGVHVHQC